MAKNKFTAKHASSLMYVRLIKHDSYAKNAKGSLKVKCDKMNK